MVIDIETGTGGVRLTTQQKELSDLRLSGIYATQYAGGYKNWHAENVQSTLQALSELGQQGVRANRAPPANTQRCRTATLMVS